MPFLSMQGSLPVRNGVLRMASAYLTVVFPRLSERGLASSAALGRLLTSRCFAVTVA